MIRSKTVTILFFIAILSSIGMAQDLRVVLGRPAETNNITTRENSWFSVISDAYLHLRIMGLKGVDAVPSDSLAEYFGVKGKYGLSHTRGQFNTAAREFNATHIIKTDYVFADGGKTIQLAVKVFATDGAEPILTHQTRFPTASTAQYLDEAILKVADALDRSVDSNYRSKLLTPIMVTDMGMVEELGESALTINEEKQTKYLEKAFATLEDIILERQNFWLAFFIAAEQSEKHKLYEEAAEYYNKLVERRQFKWPELFIRAARNYRRAEKLPETESLLQVASKYRVDNLAYRFEYAKLYAAQEKHDEAEKAFLAVLEEDPERSDALLYLAQRNNIHKKYAESIKQTDLLISLNKFLPESYFEKGKSLIGLKKQDDAISSLKEAISFRGDQSESHKLLADLFIEKEIFDTSAYHLTQALKDHPTDADLLIKTTNTYKRGGDDKGALSVLLNYQSNFPGDLRIERELGLAYFAVKDTVRARSSLEKCINMDPASKEVLLTLFDIYTVAKEWKNVIIAGNKVLPLLKKQTDINFGLGRAYFMTQQFNEAEVVLKKVISDNIAYEMANWYLGEILYSRENYKEALTYYNREKSKIGNNEKLQERILVSNFKLKQYVQARKEATSLLALNKASGFAYTHLALISLAEKKFPEAKKHVIKASQFGSVDPAIYNELGDGFTQAKMLNEAINAYSNYLKEKPQDDKVYLKIAKVYADAKKYEDAVQSYVIANELNTAENKEALADAGHVLYSIKDYVRADQMYQNYLTAGGTNNRALENYATIKYRNKLYAEAVANLDKITGEDRNKSAVTILYAKSKYNLQQYTEALPYLEKAVKVDKNDIELVEMTAITYEKTKQPAKAVPYMIGLVMNGTNEQKREYGFHLAQVYEQLKSLDKAKAQYRKNISRFPQDYRNHEALAKHYLDSKEYTATVKLLAGPAATKGAPATLSKPLAIAYNNIKNPTKAAIAFERYVATVKNDADAWYELGNIYYDQKKFAQAIPPLSETVKMMPKEKWAFYKLANSHLKTNAAPEAQKVLEKIWSTYPEDSDILALFTKVLEVTQDTVQTIKVYTQRSKLEPKNYQLNVDLGDLLFAQNRVDEGAQAYERALAIKVDSYPVRKKLIQYYTNKKNEERTFALISEGVRLFPQTSEMYLFRAEYFLRNNELPSAKLDLKKTVALNNKNDYAFFTLGVLHRKLKEFKEAGDALSTAVLLKGDNSEYRLQYARVLLELNKPKAAVAQGEEILKLENDNSSAISEVGTYFQKAGDTERAEKLFIKALALDDQCAICYRNLGVIYFDNNKNDLAEVNLDKFITLDTSDVKATRYLAEIKRSNGQTEKALFLFSRARVLAPSDDELLFKTVNAAVEDGVVDVAEKTLLEWKSSTKSDWIFTAQARVLEAQEKDKKAISLYDMALKLNSENSYAYLGLGRINLKNKELELAEQNFGRAVGYDPRNVEIYILMANTYYIQKMYKSARELLTEAEKVNKRNPDIFYYLAMVHSRERNHDLAVSTLKNALKENPNNPKIHFALASEMMEAIKPREAISEFEKVLASDRRMRYSVKVYKLMGDIYYEQLLDNKNAKKYYKKYLREGGNDKAVKEKLKTL